MAIYTAFFIINCRFVKMVYNSFGWVGSLDSHSPLLKE